MRYITIKQTGSGYWIDSSEFQRRMDEISASLPSGAAAFVRDPGHYQFGDRCMKDLRLDAVSFEFHEDTISSLFTYRAPGMTGESRLILRYSGISKYEIELTQSETGTERRIPFSGLGPVILDEMLPIEDGCTHEVECIYGRMIVACSDLEACWLDRE